MRKKEAQNNQGRKIRFKIIEKGGVSLDQKLRRSDPWTGGRCDRVRCFPCKGEKGGDCRRQGVTYNLYCATCQGEKHLQVASYPGETGRNMFDRGKEHLAYLEKQSEVDSVLWLHSLHHHQVRLDIKYTMVCTGVYKSPLDRQKSEKIQISCFQGNILINRRTEMGGAVVEREWFKYRRWGAGARR